MSHGYHRGLVAAPRGDPGEVRMQGMDGTACVVRRLAEHRAQLGRSALGDVAVVVWSYPFRWTVLGLQLNFLLLNPLVVDR
jgi:hypothetical protein